MDKIYLVAGIIGIALVATLFVLYTPESAGGIARLIVGLMISIYMLLKGVSSILNKQHKDK